MDGGGPATIGFSPPRLPSLEGTPSAARGSREGSPRLDPVTGLLDRAAGVGLQGIDRPPAGVRGRGGPRVGVDPGPPGPAPPRVPDVQVGLAPCPPPAGPAAPPHAGGVEVAFLK